MLYCYDCGKDIKDDRFGRHKEFCQMDQKPSQITEEEKIRRHDNESYEYGGPLFGETK